MSTDYICPAIGCAVYRRLIYIDPWFTAQLIKVSLPAEACQKSVRMVVLDYVSRSVSYVDLNCCS